MTQSQQQTSRRRFVCNSLSCGAWIGMMASASPAAAKRIFARGRQEDIVVSEKWGRIEKVADNVWALISVLDEKDYTTVCNGGIVAGDKGVLAVETFMSVKGSKWLAEWAEKLTGRWPTDVAITHYHSDHSTGVAGYYGEGKTPNLWVTDKTKQLIQKERPDEELPEKLSKVSGDSPTEVDLGNRKVSLKPRSGHTASDITIEVADPNVIFAGDLFFNGFVPNYADANPATLNEQVADLGRDANSIYVPGHGPMANAESLQRYQQFLKMIEENAAAAHKAGKSADEAAKGFSLPEAFKDWYIFSPQVMPRAFAAWYRHFATEQSKGSGSESKGSGSK